MKVKFKNCSGFLLLLAASSAAGAQSSPQLTVSAIPRASAKRGETMTVTVKAALAEGLHCNSNAPNDPYLIPLKLTWDAKDLGPATIVYPRAKTEKSEFSEKPLSVFEGAFDIVTKFTPPVAAPPGMGMAGGKLRYQACNAKMCFPPKTVDVKFTYDLR
jgi:hypothetical protein